MKYNNLNPLSAAILSRNIYFPSPVVTDRLLLYVESGATPLVLKMDILGLDGDKKYAADPILSPNIYTDCELFF
jgi:hypothetical protein